MSGLRFNFNQFAQESLDTFTKRFNKPETVEQVEEIELESVSDIH